jgi:hypothetical protein
LQEHVDQGQLLLQKLLTSLLTPNRHHHHPPNRHHHPLQREKALSGELRGIILTVNLFTNSVYTTDK